jgi:hypothetical protein
MYIRIGERVSTALRRGILRPNRHRPLKAYPEGKNWGSECEQFAKGPLDDLFIGLIMVVRGSRAVTGFLARSSSLDLKQWSGRHLHELINTSSTTSGLLQLSVI